MATAAVAPGINIAWSILLWLPRYIGVTWNAPRKCYEQGDALRILEDRVKENRQSAHIGYIPSENDRRSIDTRFDRLEDRAARLKEANKSKKRKIHGVSRFWFYCTQKSVKEEIEEIESELKKAGDIAEMYLS